MYQLDCEFIIKVHDHFQDQKNIYIILEYADGVRMTLIRSNSTKELFKSEEDCRTNKLQELFINCASR